MRQTTTNLKSGWAFTRRARVLLLLGAVCLLLAWAGGVNAAFSTWAGSGPLATGQGNRAVMALAVSPSGANAIYAGTGSGTVFRAVMPPKGGSPAGLTMLLLGN